jgi:hypothetical protein
MGKQYCLAIDPPAVRMGPFARLRPRMAGPFAAMERFFERLFERPAARLLAPRLEAVQVQRQLQRAMESGRQREGSRTLVPTRYRVLLHPADLVALGARDGLPAELAEGLRDYARRRGYVLASRPVVRLEASPRMSAGQTLVLNDPDDRLPRADEGDARHAAPAPVAPDGTDGGDVLPATGPNTMVFQALAPDVPRARIVVRAPGGDAVRVPISGGTLRVGRAHDNDIVLDDARVSRHHAQISVRLGTLIYTDLSSTNGSFLHGSRVHEIALGPDDVIQLGASSLTIEPAAG